jgi:hypothetical protein
LCSHIEPRVATTALPRRIRAVGHGALRTLAPCAMWRTMIKFERGASHISPLLATQGWPLGPSMAT